MIHRKKAFENIVEKVMVIIFRVASISISNIVFLTVQRQKTSFELHITHYQMTKF